MRSPLAGAGAAALTRGRAWALLHRAPEFLDDPQELPEGVHCVVRVEEPPKVSTLVVSRARALLAAGGDGEELVGRVECADAEGDILLSVWSADEQGRPASPPRLLVCRHDSGTVDLVPPIPEQLGRLDLFAPIGILRAAPPPPGPRGGGHYLITQLERAESSFPVEAHLLAGRADSSSTSSSAAAAAHRTHQIAGRADSSSAAPPRAHQRALVFSSSSGTWTAKEVHPRRFHAVSDDDEATWATVKEEEDARPPSFQPQAVLSAGLLAFLDVQHGLLLFFDPLDDTIARFIRFPLSDRDPFGLEELEEGELEPVAAVDSGHCVAFSEGGLYLLRVSPDSGRVTMWVWREEENRWVKVFQVASDEIYFCDSSITGQGSVELGAVDPTNCCNLVFFIPEAQITFMVVVNPKLGYLKSVGFVKKAVNAGRNSWDDVVIWRFDPAAHIAQGNRSVSTKGRSRGWRLSRKALGGMASSTLRIARKHIHRVQPVAELVGTVAEVFGVPGASMVAPTVAALVKTNQAACVGEEAMNWFNQPSPKEDNVVGTIQEAEDAIRDWTARQKPKGMVVTIAPELSKEELDGIADVFRRRRAEELMPASPRDDNRDYDFVGTAARYCAE